MNEVSMEGAGRSVYNKETHRIKDDKSLGKKDKKLPSQSISSPQVGDSGKIKDKKIKQLAKRDIEQKAANQFLSISGSGSRRSDQNSSRTTSSSEEEYRQKKVSREAEESDVEIEDSGDELEMSDSSEEVEITDFLEDDISHLENKYKELGESLRISKAREGAFKNFIEKLMDKKISYDEHRHIILNILRLCKDRELVDPGSDTHLLLKLIKFYAQADSKLLLEGEYMPHPHMTYELKGFIKKYLTKNQKETLAGNVRMTQIELEKIHPQIDEIERKPKTLAKASREITACLCSLVSEIMSDEISMQKNQLDITFDKIKSLKEQLGQDVGLEEIKQHKAGKESLDPQLQQVYAKKFSSYVAEEIGHQRSNQMVNNLIDLGNRLELQELKSKLSDYDLEMLEHMGRFAQQKLEKIPITEPTNDKDFTINTDIVTKSGQGEKICQHRVSILPTVTGKWEVKLVRENETKGKEKKVKKRVSRVFDNYSQAAAWVHSQLDKEFITNMGVENRFLEIVQASRLLQTVAEWAKTGARGAQNMRSRLEIPTTGTLMVSPGTVAIPIDNLSILGNVGDIVSFALILPSIFMAIEAHEKNKEQQKILNKISAYEKSMHNNILKLNELLDKHGYLNITLSSSIKKQHYQRLESKVERQIEKLLSQEKKASKKQAEISKQVEELESILHLLSDNLNILSRLKAAKTLSRDLKVEEVEKATAATTNIVGVLASFSNTAIALHHLQTTGSYAVTLASGASQTAVTASMSLGIISGVCFTVAGGVQAVIDMSRVHKNRNVKKEIKNRFNELENAKNPRGENILTDKDIELVEAVRKMQTRKINNAIASGAISIGSDLSLIGVGGASMAVAAGAVCPPALVAMPIIAGVAIGIKVGREKIVKAAEDKKQEGYVLHEPSKSDIGLIHRLRMRIKEDDAGAMLITEKLIEGIIGMPKEDFLKMTEEFEKKFTELEQMAT